MEEMAKPVSKMKDKIAYLIDKRGAKLGDVAAAMDVSTTMVKNYTKGAIPNGAALLALARYFDVSAEWLLDDKAPVNKPAGRFDYVTDRDLAMELAKRWTDTFLRLDILLDRAEKADWSQVMANIMRTMSDVANAPNGIMMRDADPYTIALLQMGCALECVLDTLDSIQVACVLSLKNDGQVHRVLQKIKTPDGVVGVDPARLYISNRITAIHEKAYPGHSNFASMLSFASKFNTTDRVYIAREELDKLDKALQACGV